MTDKELSIALNVPRSTVAKWRTSGMPTGSVDAARAWQKAHKPARGVKAKPDEHPLIYPSGLKPEDLPDDPYSVRDRLRKSEKQIASALQYWTETGLPAAEAIRKATHTHDAVLEAERNISRIHMTIKDLRQEHRLACRALMDTESAIIKLEVQRGKLISLDAAKSLLTKCLNPFSFWLKKLPEMAESDTERTKLTLIAETGLLLFRQHVVS